MENQKNTSVSEIINAEIMDVSYELKEAYEKLGRITSSDSCDWKLKAIQEKRCAMLEGKVEILNKMAEKISSISVDIPKLAAV